MRYRFRPGPLWLPLLAVLACQAASAREALVIGNSAYVGLPPLPACVGSAHMVATALRARGFPVLEQDNASVTATDAALDRLTRRVGENQDAAAVVYVCGYAAAVQFQPYLLPDSAVIDRPADLTTQAIPAEALLDALARAKVGPSLVVLDAVPMPGSTHDLGLAGLDQPDLPEGLGLLAVQEQPPRAAPTPLAAALIAALRPRRLSAEDVLDSLQRTLIGEDLGQIAGIRLPVTDTPLIQGPVTRAAADNRRHGSS